MSDNIQDNLTFGSGPGDDDQQALPKVRTDLEVTEQVYDGKPCYVLKDPTTLRYYRLRPPEYTIFGMLDGQASIDDILKVLAERFPQEEYDRQALMSFIVMLRGGNMLQVTGATGSEYLLKRKNLMTRGFFKKIRTEFLFYRIPLLDPDRMLSWMEMRLGGLIFSRFMMVLVWMLLAGAAMVVIANVEKLGQRQPLLSWINLLYIGPMLFLIKPIHEIGHGLASKHFDCEVHEMGILFLVFMPCAYCDVSDAWMISDKRKRMWITAAGVVVELVLAAGACFLWALTEPKTVLNQFALNMMVITSVNALLFNGNPLLRYDGYYFLMDLMEIPNLKQKGSAYLWYLMQRFVLGVEDAAEPLDIRGREPSVLGYAVCSAIYRWFIMIAIVTMIWRFLDPYGWGVVGAVMALGCIYNAFITPLIKFVKFLRTSHHRLHVHLATAVILAVVVGGTGYGVLGLSVEQSVDSQCILRPAQMHVLYVTQAGFIDPAANKTFIHDGQRVEPNQVLLVLSDPQLEFEMKDWQLQLKKLQIQRDRAQEMGHAGLAVVAQKNAEIDGLKAYYQRARDNWEKLTIRAPAAGIVQLRTRLPLEDLAGSFLPVGSSLLGVYEPDRFEAVTAINHRDNGLIQVNQSVQMKFWALDDEVFQSQVTVKPPKPVQKMSSAAFSTVFGGEVATMPSAKREEALEPADVTYELEIPVTDPAGRLRDGMVGRAKVMVEEKSLAQVFYHWLIRTLRQDIRL